MRPLRRFLLPLSFASLACASAFAQDDGETIDPPVPPVPVPSGAVPATPVVPVPPRPGFGRAAAQAAPAANQDNVPLADRKITESIIQPKINGNELAALYKKYTGRRVIVSAAAAQAEFAFVQEAGPDEPLTYAQAAQLLKKAAVIENFVFVPDGDIDKLLVATGGANPKGNGLSVYDQTTGLPDGDEVVHYVMTLRYLKPEQAQQVFNQIVGQFGPYGSIAAVPNASALVITENTSLIRKLIELKDQIDKPSSDVGTRFIKVQYADVTELAQTLNEMLGAQQQAQRSASVQRATPQPAAPNPAANNALAAAGEGGTAGEEAPVQIVPDARTNRIFAMGRPVDLVFVEGLVREFDTPTDNRNYLRRKLRFLSVTDFLPVAGDALNRAFSGNAQGGAGGGAGSSGANFGGNNRTASNNRGTSTNSRSSSGTSTSSRSSSGGSSSYGGSSGGGFGSSGSGGSGGSGGSTRGDSLDAPNVSTAPQSLLVGRTLLVADNITNTIVVQGPPASVEIIQKLLDQVDVKAQQVLISTVFGQLSLNDDLDYGVQWLKTFNQKTTVVKDDNGTPDKPEDDTFKTVLGPTKNGFAGSQIGTPLRNLVDPRGLIAPTIFGSVDGKDLTGNFPATGGLSLYGTIANNLSVYLHALKASGKFSILSRPSIYTANNQKGMISSGQRIAVPTNSYQGGASTGISTNIEYRDVVLKLEVVPLVNSEHEVTLQIALVNDDIIGEQDVEGVGKVPTIGTRELTTTVTVPNNSTVILGGLITTSEKSSKSGIPLLMDIPYLGSVFSTTSKTKDRSELLIFIQPTIVGNDKELDRVQADVDGRYKVSPELRHFADGPGAIPPPDGIVPAGEKASDYQPKPEETKQAKPSNNTFNRTGRHR